MNGAELESLQDGGGGDGSWSRHMVGEAMGRVGLGESDIAGHRSCHAHRSPGQAVVVAAATAVNGPRKTVCSPWFFSCLVYFFGFFSDNGVRAEATMPRVPEPEANSIGIERYGDFAKDRHSAKRALFERRR